MRKVIYLHAGTYKTATTLIQSLMVAHENDLLEKGVYIPKTGLLNTDKIYNHAPIAYELLRHDNPKKWRLLHKMLDEAKSSGYNKILISSEDLSALSTYPHRLKKLKSVLRSEGYTIKIILSTRNPEEFAESFYVEMVKEGYSESPDGFVNDVMKNRSIIHTKPNGIRIKIPLNKNGIVGPFINTFGTGNVLHTTYSRSVVKWFFRIFRMDISGSSSVLNERYDSNKISFLICANKILSSFNVNKGPAMRNLNRVLRRLPNRRRFELPEGARRRLNAYLKSL